MVLASRDRGKRAVVLVRPNGEGLSSPLLTPCPNQDDREDAGQRSKQREKRQ